MNLYGFRASVTTSIGTKAYLQAYRNGMIESVMHGIVSIRRPPAIWSPTTELYLVTACKNYLSCLEKLGFQPPFAILVALLGASQACIDPGSFTDDVIIGSDRVLFDDVVIEEMVRDEQGVAQVLRPIFDQLANAGGRACSKHFDTDGTWKPSR